VGGSPTPLSPAFLFKMKKLPEIITESELIKILKDTNKKHHITAFILGFYQCMRVSEVVKLQEENIRRNMKMLLIKQAKGAKDRNIPISPNILKFLKEIPIKCGARALQIAFRLKAKEVLNKDLHFHNLRHSGATYYLNVRKWNLRQVQQFLGHSNIQTTQIYTHISPQNLMEAMYKDDIR